MNPTLEEIKDDAKSLFVIYVFLTCYGCYIKTFDYYFAVRYIDSIIMFMIIPFATGYLQRSFVVLVFLDAIFNPFPLPANFAKAIGIIAKGI